MRKRKGEEQREQAYGRGAASGQMFFSQLNQFDVSIFHDATSFFPP
jgi:hypothetical protein